MEKWRGIKTTQVATNEDKPKTIINRLGQKSISLPRIDDNKRWAGYPSLAGTARRIAKLVPECYYYVEPFAGTAKVYQELSISRYTKPILNDKSKFVCEWLTKEFEFANITNEDFIECVKKWDSERTFFLFDMPWYKSYYDQIFSCFDRESVKQYDDEVLDLCRNIKGKFIITTRKENRRMLKSGFTNKLVESEYVLCGHYPKVLLTSNLPLR